MKKIIRSLIICTVIFSFTSVNAQTDADAFRYTGTSITGTARYTAMSGAFGALGGDFSVLSTNPAGIGIYRSSEVTFTPSIFTANTKSTFQGNQMSENKTNFNFGNAGLVLTSSTRNSGEGWKSWNFGFGYNRQDNYNSYMRFQGRNSNNSMLDHFAEDAGNLTYDNLNSFYNYLAYYTYLINPDIDTAPTQYTPAITEYGETQRMAKETRGSKGETVFTFGGNYNDKLYLGLTMGISSINYTETSIYEEVANSNVIDSVKNYQFEENFTTNGTGVNFKFGMIYKPQDAVRFGIAIHTPTWYSMHDYYKNFMTSRFINGQTYYAESPDGSFDYDMTTPFKALGSLGFIFGDKGILGIDYEFTDFAASHFNSPNYAFFDENRNIETKYNVAHTLRVGTEWRYQNLSFRGGVSYVSSPIKPGFTTGDSDYSKRGFSAGIGFKEKGFFIDLGYLYSQSNQYYQPYTLMSEEVPGVKNDLTTHNFTITCGYKF